MVNTSLLRILRHETKTWWANIQDRKNGQIKIARQREHSSLRQAIKSLRAAIKSKGYGSVGRGGYTLTYVLDAENGLNYGDCRTSGYGNINSALIQVAIRLGIPVYDSTVIPDDKIIEVLKFPMIAIKEVDAEPYHSMSFAPLDHVFKLYRDLGATTYNWG